MQCIWLEIGWLRVLHDLAVVTVLFKLESEPKPEAIPSMNVLAVASRFCHALKYSYNDDKDPKIGYKDPDFGYKSLNYSRPSL